jgi:hypothetical protein
LIARGVIELPERKCPLADVQILSRINRTFIFDLALSPLNSLEDQCLEGGDMRVGKPAFVLFGVLLAGSATLHAQTPTSAVVVGTVRDMSGAVIAAAHVTLQNTAMGATREQDTSAAGTYTFPDVPPGAYLITVSREGFKTATIASLSFDVNKSYTVDVPLEIGSAATRVEVAATATVELQTTDATIGEVVANDQMVNLPTISRNAMELLTLQPTATPLAAQGDRLGAAGGSVSGARTDQNAVMLDGIDISDIFNAGLPTSDTIVPLNVESLSEFRVGVSNPNAAIASASGGQVSVASKAGTNALHGTVYWYVQNTAFNANTWENNHTIDPSTGKTLPRATIHDNRGGFSLGGPIRKDKTFFFVNYEPRRFITTYVDNRAELNLPSADFRNGIINFTNPVTGMLDVACIQNAQQVAANVSSPHSAACSAIAPNASAARISSNCGPTANASCDPRGLGMSPTVAALLNVIKPTPDDPTQSDGAGCSGALTCQNFSGYLFNGPSPIRDDAFSVRLDHNFSQNIHFFGRYSWFRDIFTPLGSPAETDLTKASHPFLDSQGTRGDDATGGLDWGIRNNLINSFHFGWVRQRIDNDVLNGAEIANRLQLPGANGVYFQGGWAGGPQAGGLIAQPITPSTQGFTRGKNIQFTDDLNWIKGTHAFAFGADVRWQPTSLTGDISVGGASVPNIPLVVSDGGSQSNINTASAFEPGGDSAAMRHLYYSALGLVSSVGYYQPLDPTSFQPVSGHPVADLETQTHSLYFYAQDSWRIKPSLTLTYGLGWGYQSPYGEDHGRADVLVQCLNPSCSSNAPVHAEQFMATKKAMALQGKNYNPTFGYVPYGKLGMSGMWNPDWGDWAPRVSIAWSPDATNGRLGKLIGNKKTVIRAGYAMAYDRLGGGTISHLLGQAPGFYVSPQSVTPGCSASGVPGANCVTSSTDPTQSIFRIGFDGPVPVPTLPGLTVPLSATNPFVPGATGNPPSPVDQSNGQVFMYDTNFKVGRNHMVDFSVQRELPGNMIMEIGYMGRLGRRLPAPYMVNSVPYMFKDVTKLDGTPGSSQAFAQAYDCIAQTLRYGAVSNWPAMPKLGNFACQGAGGALMGQPWFENQMPAGWGASGAGCGVAGMSNTQCISSQQGPAFVQGNLGLNSPFGAIFGTITAARCQSAVTLADFQSCSLLNMQQFDLQERTSNDYSNYHAIIATLRNRGWHGMFYDLNYTFSRCLDQGGRPQGFLNGFDDSFNLHAMYGPCYFDRTHVFNGTFNYDLPFGTGHKLSAGGGVNRIIGGWYMSGIIRVNSGLPLVVAESGLAYGGGLITSNNVDMIPTGSGGFTTGLNKSTGDTVPASCANYANAMGGTTLIGSAGATLGYNYFSDPAAAYCSFRPILLTSDTRDGRAHPLRGFGLSNVDASIGKETAVTERFKLKFSADFFNVFNHVTFQDPLNPAFSTGFIDPTNASGFGGATFGVITKSFVPPQRQVGSRWIQLGLRLSF